MFFSPFTSFFADDFAAEQALNIQLKFIEFSY